MSWTYTKPSHLYRFYQIKVKGKMLRTIDSFFTSMTMGGFLEW